ncbi:MAG TPA: helix-turn-helix transcriptional regulator [Thermomicrobiales bacterium]|jgi:transcriptional regulator with XRE-family HTH domain
MGEEGVDLERSEASFQMVATTDRTVTEALDRIEKDLGLTEQEVASALGVSTQVIERWRHRQATPDRETAQRLDQLVALYHHLRETLAPEAVPGWLRWTPEYLGGITPADAIVRGQTDRVEALLTVIDHGIFT